MTKAQKLRGEFNRWLIRQAHDSQASAWYPEDIIELMMKAYRKGRKDGCESVGV